MSLGHVLGQPRAVRLLLNTLKTGRIPSAMLFAGEPGIGKKYTAINFAKAINCLSNGSDSCDSCSSCKKIESGIHPDFLFLKPEKGEIRIDDIRSIEDALSFRPFEGKRKLVIIDEAERMNQSASNAFLKTLEEPPSGSVIILITSSPESLPSTIRSRCCRISFTPIPEKETEEILKRINLFDSDLKTLIRLSMGRPGLIASSDTIRDREKLLKVMRMMLKGDKNPWKGREEVETFVEYMLLILRDMVVYRLDGGILNMDIKDYIKEIAEGVSIRDIIDTFERLLMLRSELGFNLNIGITWNYISHMLRTLKGGSRCLMP